MRAARLVRMVLLLRSRHSMTAAELAREPEVSERTATRDAQALSQTGVPVYADRGRAGGTGWSAVTDAQRLAALYGPGAEPPVERAGCG